MNIRAAVVGALRRAAARPPLRSVVKQPQIERVISTSLRASVVDRQARFVLRELMHRRLVATYRVRSTGQIVFVRHGSPDVAVLDEVFYQRQYDVPGPAAALLATLDRPPQILDLGANIGLFGLAMLAQFPEARIISFEPDRANVELLRRCVEANEGPGGWEVVEAAAFTRDGEIAFSSGGFSLSRIELNAPTEGREMVPSVDALPYLENSDLAKVDIEGGEWPIVEDVRFAAAAPPILALEYHPYLAPEADPRDAAHRLLRAAGYEVQPAMEFAFDHGLVWAWRGRRA